MQADVQRHDHAEMHRSVQHLRDREQGRDQDQHGRIQVDEHARDQEQHVDDDQEHDRPGIHRLQQRRDLARHLRQRHEI